MSEKLNELYEQKKNSDWNSWDENNLVNLAHNFAEFQRDMKNTDKRDHFMQFIR